MANGSVIHDASSALAAVVTHLEDVLLPRVDPSERFYDWAALPMNEFMTGMSVCREYLVGVHKHWPPEGYQFLDLGCGIGTKLIVAQLLGYQVTGVEIRPEYAQVATRICPESTVLEGDALVWEDFEPYDVVYMYRLCVDLNDQAALNEHIASRMRSGALFFVAGGPDPQGLRPIDADAGVWVVD